MGELGMQSASQDECYRLVYHHGGALAANRLGGVWLDPRKVIFCSVGVVFTPPLIWRAT